MKYTLPTLLFFVLLPVQLFAAERGAWLEATAIASTVPEVVVITEYSSTTATTTASFATSTVSEVSTTSLAVATSTATSSVEQDLNIATTTETGSLTASTSTSSTTAASTTASTTDSLDPNSPLAETFETAKALGLTEVYLRFPAMFDESGELIGGGVGNHNDFAAALDLFSSEDVDVHAWIVNGKRLTEDQWVEEAIWVDLCEEEEREAQQTWVTAVLELYPQLAGIELDYIRFPGWEMADEEKTACITDTVEIISTAIDSVSASTSKDYQLSAAVFPLLYSYAGGRWGDLNATTTEVTWEGETPQWFREWYEATPDNPFITTPIEDSKTEIYEMRTQATYSPRLVFDATSFHYQQDPTTWLRRDLLDVIHVMQYSSTQGIWEREVDAWQQMAPDIADRVMVGIGWLDSEREVDDWGHYPESFERSRNYAEAAGILGTSIYTIGERPELDAGLINFIENPDERVLAFVSTTSQKIVTTTASTTEEVKSVDAANGTTTSPIDAFVVATTTLVEAMFATTTALTTLPVDTQSLASTSEPVATTTSQTVVASQPQPRFSLEMIELMGVDQTTSLGEAIEERELEEKVNDEVLIELDPIEVPATEEAVEPELTLATSTDAL